MVMGKRPVPGDSTIWVIVGQGPIPLAVGAGGSCLNIFTLLYLFSPVRQSKSGRLPEIGREHKWSLNPKQPTNQKIQNSFVKR